jgi:poly(3-hydroxybutyrate) depolymerase
MIKRQEVMERIVHALALLALLVVLPGCPVNLNHVAGDTEKLTESQTGYKYYLYVPSWHNNDSHWPVIVTCHGTNPYDTAWAQIHEWRGLAEQYGLLVVSPELKATDSTRVFSVPDQIQRQREDEEAILNIVQRTITSLNGDPDRVFIVGWSGGGYAVYHTGLRNPKIFRAAAIRMGNFDERFFPDVPGRMDPYQPIFIFLASEDIPAINTQCRNAYQWLKNNGMKRITIKEVAGIHERKPGIAFSSFKDVIEQFAYVRLNAVKGVGGDPLKVQFYAKVTPSPSAVVWDFGDHKRSTEFSPQHRYARPGIYDVKVTIITANTARTERKLKLDLADK